MSLDIILSTAGFIFADLSLFGAMMTGITMGMLFGAAPGLSVKMGILLLMPLMFGMDPAFGIVLLLSMHAVVHTGGAIPSILFGVPGGAAEAATVLDGYPMARKGAAGEALGAAIAASAIGGALGAFSYFLLLPGFAAIGRLFGAPEYLLLALLGLSAVGTLSHASPLKGLAMGALGLLAGAVGLDHASGTPRFVFGSLELWDGIDILILVTGFFAMPELMDLARHGSNRCTYRAMFRGMAATWHHRWLTLRTSIIGILIGMMPGLGAEVASWLAYGHAVQTSPDRARFGKGAIEGVIAPETANNSKEGGGFLPTVVFGIPGTAAMALLISAFTILGLPVGPSFVRDYPDMVALIGWTILWSNLIAVAFFMATLPFLGRLVFMRIELVAPVVMAIAVTGTLIDHAGWWSLFLLLGVSTIGCLLATFDWPRAPLLLGFIMGRLAEINLVKTVELYDWTTIQRWPSLVLLAALALILYQAVRRSGSTRGPLRRGDRMAAAFLCMVFAAAAITALGFPVEAMMLPVFAGTLGALLTACLALQRIGAPAGAGTEAEPARPIPWQLLAILAFYLTLIPLAGILPATMLYTVAHALIELRLRPLPALMLAAAVAVIVWVLFGLWLRQPLFYVTF
jgi:TctA family transporter